MSTEAPRPNNEAPKPVDFYNPITDRAITLKKLTALFKKEPTDVELFEAVVDTFTTMATAEFHAGVLSTIDGFKAREWQHTDEVVFEIKRWVPGSIGYHQPGEGETRLEKASIDSAATNIRSISFQRNSDGLITVYQYDGEKDEDRPYEIPLDQRKVIVKTLLEVMNFQQPATT